MWPGVLVTSGLLEQAALLIGAIRASSAMGSPTFQRLIDSLRPRLERELGTDELERLIATGAAMPIERAMLLAEEALQKLELSHVPGRS